MSSRAPSSGPLREARSCHDHLAGQLGVALTQTALDRGWVIADGEDWSLAADAADRIADGLGLQLHLDATSRRPDVRLCQDWTEHAPHLAGRLGAALLSAMRDAGWVEPTAGSRALTVTSLGAQWLLRTGVHGVVVDESGCDADSLCYSGGVSVTAAAAQDWGGLVERAAREGWMGVSALAAFRGTVSDAVTRNVSAYGQQVADTIWSVRTWDRVERTQRTFAMADCEFRGGGSRLAPNNGQARYDVIDVAFLFRAGTITPPLLDPDLLHLLDAQQGDRVPLARVRDAVLAVGPNT